MNDIKEDYQKGDSGIEYPDSIKNQPNAQAFYGVTVDVINEETEANAEYQTENNKEKAK
jgi:type I restriction enzyme R subunit